MSQENDVILEQGLSGLGYCSHASADDIERVRRDKKSVPFAWLSDGCYGPEHDMGALVELTDGTYAVIYEGEDTTGHGCKCSGDLTFFPTLDEAVRMGLNQSDRATFASQQAGK